MKKEHWKDYFSFTKKERTALVILFIIMVGMLILPYAYPSNFGELKFDKETDAKISQLYVSANDSVAGANAQDTTISSHTNLDQSPVLFEFDPNTLDADGWKKLGIKDKVIHTILNYRNKGGRFKVPADIEKIYGLSKKETSLLLPYIKIKEQPAQTIKTYAAQPKEKAVEIKPVHINTATAEEWKALPGIGDVLSNRIVKFRNKAGGFTSIDQVAKTYGLPDSTFQKIKPWLKLD